MKGVEASRHARRTRPGSVLRPAHQQSGSVYDASGGQLAENAFVPETGWTAQINPGGITTAISSPNHESDGIWSMGWMSEQELKKRSRKRTSNNRTTTGFRISDELWAVLQPLLPVPLNTHRFSGGRPRVPDRRCADAIFYVLRTGCQWQALDQTELCAHSTAHDRFQEWVQAGVFLKLWQAGLEQFEETCGIDWQWLSMDGAMTKAPHRRQVKPGSQALCKR